MTRLLDVMEEYLTLKQYRYLRLDGHTSGSDRGALIDLFNQSDSPYFIFLLSAEDRREYLESLLRECKKEEAAPVLDDDALNDILARSILPC
ncbi:hypothetical protein TanjilG_18380 [Lupinus angustifolius]|uniref:Uncharacterized protein n=1 Tax=Lupinus angustifolius TaxID=3871 RepID=A0A4P1RWB1_LUPAN|nr:hypothetical protein TanjilG_18380 [Lupinus angustifolius]